jgi:DNA-binding Xre family transcriptional regulator
MFKINVRQLASDKDWNISDLWRATGIDKNDRVDYNTLILYWHGYIKRMNVKDLIKICDALHCDLSELIEYEHKK